MEERRKFERKLLSYFSRVIAQDSDWLLGYIVNLTTGGAMMAGELPLEVNSLIRLRIDLPEAFSDQKQMELCARVVWCKPDKDPGMFCTGLQLVDLDPKAEQIIVQLIKMYGLDR